MAYITTATLGLKLADPNTIQAFETAVVNGNFTALESAIVADRARLSQLDPIKPYALASAANPGLVPAGSSAARNTFWGTPGDANARRALQNKGARWMNTDADKNYTERYWANKTDGGSNPAGATVAGWYADTRWGTDYTPVLNGVTLGNGTLRATYTLNGDRCSVDFFLLFGSTTTVGGLKVRLPINASAVSYGGTANQYALGTVRFLDAGTNGFAGVVDLAGSDLANVSIDRFTVNGAQISTSSISSMLPFQFKSGDQISASFTYIIAQ